MARETLPNELLWDAGHASELALSSIADGQESLLSREVVSHVHSCDACAMKLGEAALEMRGVMSAVQSAKPWLPASIVAPVPKRKASGAPMPAMIVAVVVAALGAVPTLMALPRRLAELALTMMHTLPVVSRSGVQVFQQGLGGAWLSAMCACAFLLVLMGFAVTRLLPRPATS